MALVTSSDIIDCVVVVVVVVIVVVIVVVVVAAVGFVIVDAAEHTITISDYILK